MADSDMSDFVLLRSVTRPPMQIVCFCVTVQ
jgi:hypothetical protein